MPTYILGRWELASSPAALSSGSNGAALSNVLCASMPNPMYGMTVHVADVARVHVEAVTNEQIKTHEDFVLNANRTEGTVWPDTIKIMEKHFPEAVAKGMLPLGEGTQIARRRIDGSKTERMFGMKMIPFKEQIISLVGQYVELTEAARSEGMNEAGRNSSG